MPEIVKLMGCEKSFGVHNVLNGINFSINEGEIVSIIGKSGCGKTTLLRVVAGLEKPENGEVIINRDKYATGMVFQDFHLWPHKNLLENVTEALLTVKKLPKEIALSEGEKALSTFGLLKNAEKYPHQLSGGERQRAAIARALATKPKILLLDEITSNLDWENSFIIKETLKSLAQNGLSVINVSHKLDFVNEISDKIFVLEEGKLIEVANTSGYKESEISTTEVGSETRKG